MKPYRKRRRKQTTQAKDADDDDDHEHESNFFNYQGDQALDSILNGPPSFKEYLSQEGVGDSGDISLGTSKVVRYHRQALRMLREFHSQIAPEDPQSIGKATIARFLNSSTNDRGLNRSICAIYDHLKKWHARLPAV